MFLQVSVCPRGRLYNPWADIPQDRNPPGQTTPLPRWLLQRTVRILMEFILVGYVNVVVTMVHLLLVDTRCIQVHVENMCMVVDSI